MYNIEDIKKFIKQRKYAEQDYQIYNTRNLVGDPMKTVYNKDGIIINECYYCSYIEIFGITEEDYKSLYTGRFHKIK